MRPLWNGTITFGLVVIPVRLYAATERKSVSFRLLHKECSSPIRYMKWCPTCEKELAQDEIVRAYEYRKGEHVIITDEDLEAIPGPSAHVIEILDFVTLREVDPIYYEKSFFLEPQKGAEKAYSLLLRSMEDQGKVALSKVAIRAKETLAIVRTYKGKFLLLETMYWADEVRSGEELDIPDRVDVGERELAMATPLIETLSSDFDPARYRSAQRDAVAELIEKKIQGKEIVKQPEVKGEVIDLMEALRRSVEKAKMRSGEGPGEAPAKPKRRRRASGETTDSAAPPPPS